MGENAKACSLSFHATLRVFEATGRVGMFADVFRADEEFVWAVADPGNADRRVNLVDRCHIPSNSNAFRAGLPSSRINFNQTSQDRNLGRTRCVIRNTSSRCQ
jgi:hypothetical protein